MSAECYYYAECKYMGRSFLCIFESESDQRRWIRDGGLLWEEQLPVDSWRPLTRAEATALMQTQDVGASYHSVGGLSQRCVFPSCLRHPGWYWCRRNAVAAWEIARVHMLNNHMWIRRIYEPRERLDALSEVYPDLFFIGPLEEPSVSEEE